MDIEALRNSKITDYSESNQLCYKSLTGDQFKPQPLGTNFKCIRKRMGLDKELNSK